MEELRMIEYNDLNPYVGAYIRVGVPDDTGRKSIFNWYGTLEKVYNDRIKLVTDTGQILFIKLERVIEFSTRGNGDNQ